MEAGIAVLEQIAISTDKSLGEMRQDLRDLRQDLNKSLAEMCQELREFRQDLKTMLGLGLAATATILAVMAHGFHWL